MAEENDTKKPDEKKKFSPKRLGREEMDLITRQVDEKLHDFMKDGKYKEVLIAMGNLGKYSLNNQIYILLQKPDAVTVHGMKKWNVMGRHVIPGEKSIKIFSPIIKTEEKEAKDSEGNPVLDKDGKPEKQRKQVVVGFEQGYVFDVSQTDGKPLDVFKFDEKKAVENKDKILKGLADVVKEKGYTISHATAEELGQGVYGLCDRENHRIKILEGMSDLQEVSTTVHECGHALAHTDYRKDFEGLTPMEKKEIKEVEAESIACVVCTFLGLDTQNFNFSYIAGWSDGDIEKFEKNLDVISKHSKTLIGGIEKQLFSEAQPKEVKQVGESKPEGPKAASPAMPTPPLGQPKTSEAEMA